MGWRAVLVCMAKGFGILHRCEPGLHTVGAVRGEPREVGEVRPILRLQRRCGTVGVFGIHVRPVRIQAVAPGVHGRSKRVLRRNRVTNADRGNQQQPTQEEYHVHKDRYHSPSTFTRTPSLWLLNSGAYMHMAVVMPLLKSPACVTRSVYSNTYVPGAMRSKKKFVLASRMLW